MSRPVGDDTFVSPLAHHWLGIWKSPVKIPVSGPVSTNVKPVSESPVSTPGLNYNPVQVLVVHNSSSNVISNNLPRFSPLESSKSAEASPTMSTRVPALTVV